MEPSDFPHAIDSEQQIINKEDREGRRQWGWRGAGKVEFVIMTVFLCLNFIIDFSCSCVINFFKKFELFQI